MSIRTVISFAMDLIGSTSFGLDLNAIRFRQYNKAIIKQIWPYVRQFNLEDSSLKFTGDGWLLFNPDLDKANSIVALAKTLSATFQKEIAKDLNIEAPDVPALRLAICTGEDEEVNFGDSYKDWVGDSARRATRALGICVPNQLIVNSTIHEKIYRSFATQVIVVSKLPENRRPAKWEEDFRIYSVGEIRSDFVNDLRLEDDATASAPYVTYLHLTGRTVQAKQVFAAVGDIIALESESIAARELHTPAEIAKLADVSTQMRKLLYSAPTRDMREDIVNRMTKLGLPIPLPLYNTLIHKSLTHDEATDWFERLKRDGLIPNTFTYTTLINLSPNYETATKWFDTMREAGVVPDRVTFSILVNRSPDYATATKWFDAMREAGVAPDVVTFNTLVNRSPDYETATKWFGAIRDADVAPTEVTFSTLINRSPDYETATKWLDAMREAGIQATENTTSALAKKIRSLDDASRLTEKLLDSGGFVGEGYYAAIYRRLSQHLSAEELLAWHSKQKFKHVQALAAAIHAYANRGKIEQACRVALAFPFLSAATKVFCDNEDVATAYFSDLVAKGFELQNSTYALGWCLFENGRFEKSIGMLERALSLSTHEKRSEAILAKIEAAKRMLGLEPVGDL